MGKDEGSNLAESFNKAASTYECRMGTLTRAIANHMVAKFPLPQDAYVCDNACGTGAITDAYLSNSQNVRVAATDSSAGMIDIVAKAWSAQGLQSRVDTKVQDSICLDYPDDVFDIQAMGFGIFFTSDETQAAKEIYRTLKPRGHAMVTCWKESTLFRLLFDVQRAISPVNPLSNLPMLERWSDPNTLSSVMQAGGFTNVKMTEVPADLTGETLHSLVKSCSENFHGMVGDQWTAKEKAKIEEATEKLLSEDAAQYLSVDQANCKGIRWVAWLATATK